MLDESYTKELEDTIVKFENYQTIFKSRQEMEYLFADTSIKMLNVLLESNDADYDAFMLKEIYDRMKSTYTIMYQDAISKGW